MLVIALCFSLVACQNRITKNEAKETAEKFIDFIEKGNFDAAKDYLHPERPLDLEKYFNDIEMRMGVDFQKGVQITRYTDFSSSIYDSDVGGADYELDVDIIVDGIAFELSIDIVKNDLGYGIYNIEFDRD